MTASARRLGELVEEVNARQPRPFFTTGLHDDYHEPSDAAPNIDYDKLARVAGLVRDLAVEVANRPGRPVAYRPLPPPGAPCS